MRHRQVLESLSGLLLALFVAMVSSTVVSTALPRIIGAGAGRARRDHHAASTSGSTTWAPP